MNQDYFPEHNIPDYEKINYPSFWGNKKRAYLEKIEKYVLANILQKAKNTDLIIDIGGGFGRLSSVYLNRFKKIIFFDYSRTLILEAATRLKNNKNVFFVQGDLFKLPFKENTFDTLVMMRVFHHLDDPECAIKELRKVIKNQGILIFSFYNKHDLRGRIKYFLRKKQKDSRCSFHERIKGDNLLFVSKPKFVFGLLKKYGFIVKERFGIGLFIGRFLALSHLFLHLDKFFSKFLGTFYFTFEIIVHSKIKK